LVENTLEQTVGVNPVLADGQTEAMLNVHHHFIERAQRPAVPTMLTASPGLVHGREGAPWGQTLCRRQTSPGGYSCQVGRT